MRHYNRNRKLSRVRKTRRALINSLAQSLVLHQRIRTTEPKAKELRPFIEKMVTRGKAGTISSRRLIGAKIGAAAAKVLIDTISKRYQEKRGGYTRIVKLGRRASDGSKMAIIEFVK